MLDFIDTHIHLQDFKADCALRVLEHKSVKKMVLVSAVKDDFISISALLQKYPEKLIGAFGIHPWYAKEKFDIEQLQEMLKQYPNALVGEIGVDELKEPVSPEQHFLFSMQLKLAQDYNRLVIVHAAKAFNALQEHEAELKKVKYVHHGFVKNKELLKFICKTGGYIGLGTLFLKQDKAYEMWQMMPKDKILFETDAPYRIKEEEYTETVQNNLRQLAHLVEEDETELAHQLMHNAEVFLKI